MKIAYFDCFSGISGDMILGALLDLGLSVEFLKKELKKVNISGYEIKVKKVEKNHIFGTEFTVTVKEKQKARTFRDISEIIDNSRLDREVKAESKKIFRKLGKAEGKIHNLDLEKVHFHEIGAVDSIIDIVGAIIGIKKLGIEKIYCSYLPLGRGFTTCSHGVIPLPSPATLEILKNIPVYYTRVNHEMVTPTGAAIITSVCEDFCEMPLMKIDRIGYGVGKTSMDHPNLLRVIVGEQRKEYGTEATDIIETNIDDMNPEFYDYLINKLYENGALDVFLTNIQMKKNRPGVKLSVISQKENTGKIIDTIFSESTTLGVRIHETKRVKLHLEIKKVETKYGNITVKIGKINDEVVTISPEYEDCKRIAKERKVPLKEVYELVKRKV